MSPPAPLHHLPLPVSASTVEEARSTRWNLKNRQRKDRLRCISGWFVCLCVLIFFPTSLKATISEFQHCVLKLFPRADACKPGVCIWKQVVFHSHCLKNPHGFFIESPHSCHTNSESTLSASIAGYFLCIIALESYSSLMCSVL